MKPELIGYCLAALVVAFVIYSTWQFIVGGLAVIGLWCLFNHHSKPPRCR